MNRHRRHALEVRLAALEILGGKCIVCGTTDVRVLDIDHKHGGGTKERKLGIHHRMLERMIIAGKVDLDHYQILCANDHRVKTYESIRQSETPSQEQGIGEGSGEMATAARRDRPTMGACGLFYLASRAPDVTSV
jgi:hypothetical protein